MKDERDDRGTHPIENGGYRLEVSEMDIEGTQGGDDHEVWKDKGPSAKPGAPKSAAQICGVDSDLNCQRPGQRLTDGNRLSHLFLGQPSPLGDELPFHLADQRDRTAESQQAEAEKVDEQFRQSTGFCCHWSRHVALPGVQGLLSAI